MLADLIYHRAPYHVSDPNEAAHVTLSISPNMWTRELWSIFHVYMTNITGVYEGYRCASPRRTFVAHLTGVDAPNWFRYAQQQRRPFPETAAYVPPVPPPPPPPPPAPPAPPAPAGNAGPAPGAGGPAPPPGNGGGGNGGGPAAPMSWAQVARAAQRVVTAAAGRVLPRSTKGKITTSTNLLILAAILMTDRAPPPEVVMFNTDSEAFLIPFESALIGKQAIGYIPLSGSVTSVLFFVVAAVFLLSSLLSAHHADEVWVEVVPVRRP